MYQVHPEMPMEWIGHRIRLQRKRVGMTVEEVAEKIGLSQSMVSQVERGKAKPSLDTIWKLSILLDVPLNYFFEGIEKEPVLVVPRESQEILKMRHENVHYRVLTPLTGRKIEFFELIVSPGHVEEMTQLPHQGEECGIVIQGELEVLIDDQAYHLKKGDCIYFDSTYPHAFRNLGEEEAIAIWAGTPWSPIEK
ncbi:helix-turn-helix domain-containing protein [Ammoniphilus sp. CFH 90114]|uniref:helix-turn-helix domain-containing protein n=1 Tax=Ammoniphilus sp. CFH 90114 TaxID=2493665 RepID=UPI00100E315D|nr:XRE family transcriptional regulator [Ammoniphilus sp. CFH 90114]RXT07781.1 helix-turn-helix domain-containing protein [Ammoniphilus sp. CFH 90114]